MMGGPGRLGYEETQGSKALVVSMPHSGLWIPPALEARLTKVGEARHDTDWHIPQLYSFLAEKDVTILQARNSRTLIDLNRPPDGRSLYPGQSVTELCPTTSFSDQKLYRKGKEPDAVEVSERRELYWAPYHQRLAGLLTEKRAIHGKVVLWDAHSIRSEVPRFFEGRLPDLNIGTNSGESCDPQLAERLAEVAGQAEGFTSVLDGRFKGGYITRKYGRPADGIHAVQLELAQVRYMEEAPPYPFLEDRAAELRPVLEAMVDAVLAWLEE